MRCEELKLNETCKISRDQLQAAYALNLCAVSVSQIIDYNDITILEQEYETILNNLNLECMPKDEALLDIIKQLLQTITFFRIQDGDKAFIEKEYQHKMKHAIWSAVPNLGLLVAGGNPVTMAISLASQVGIGYMNYRKNRAEYQLECEKQHWQLRKTAMEQFQALQQELFETSWRLADKYDFPDEFRLTERQIKQYDAILMDENEMRKYERLLSVKDRFTAYPPFWYYLGNTANSIACSEHYGFDDCEKNELKREARKYFECYQEINKFNLLREDNIAAACSLEYADLLDPITDRDKIKKLLENAEKAAGNAFDVLQLCAIGYIRIKCVEEASRILRQLVNEEYNTVTNAQLLSAIYVEKWLQTQDDSFRKDYRILQWRANPKYLFPMPSKSADDTQENLLEQFIETQRKILKTKYKLILVQFINKYEEEINKIIPLPTESAELPNSGIYSGLLSAKEERLRRMQLFLENGTKSQQYKEQAKTTSYSSELMEILNRMFSSLCLLECIQDQHKQLRLADLVKKAIHESRDDINGVQTGLRDFNVSVYKQAQSITLERLAKDLFYAVAGEVQTSVKRMNELADFAIAEVNLENFCNHEGFANPEILYERKNDADITDTSTTYFLPELLEENIVVSNTRIESNMKMIQLIKDSIDYIVINKEIVEFYTLDDSRIERYFFDKSLQKSAAIRTKAIAVLNDHSKYDMDLVFTSEGIAPIICGKLKAVVGYNDVKKVENSLTKELMIGKRYTSENLNMDALYALIQHLATDAAPIDRMALMP